MFKQKIKQALGHIIYVLFSNTIYGLILYFVYVWFSGYSLLLAFFGNFALIIAGLAVDESTIKYFESEKTVKYFERTKLSRSDRYFLRHYTSSFVSFRTALYVFYIFILVLSQVLEFNPDMLGEKMRSFILSNSYSILLLIAADMLLAQFSKDKERMKKIGAKYTKFFDERSE